MKRDPQNKYRGTVENRIWSFRSVLNPYEGQDLLNKFMVATRDEFIEAAKKMGEHYFPGKFDKLIFEFGVKEMGRAMESGTWSAVDSIHEYTTKCATYNWDHCSQPGISRVSVEFADGEILDYLVVNFVKPPPSMYDHAINEWASLTKDTIRYVARNGACRWLAAPLNNLPDFLSRLDHALEFHNKCYTQMSHTAQVIRVLTEAGIRTRLDYVDIKLTLKTPGLFKPNPL